MQMHINAKTDIMHISYITNNIIIILEIDMSRTLGSDQGQCICSAKCGQHSQGRGEVKCLSKCKLEEFSRLLDLTK